MYTWKVSPLPSKINKNNTINGKKRNKVALTRKNIKKTEIKIKVLEWMNKWKHNWKNDWMNELLNGPCISHLFAGFHFFTDEIIIKTKKSKKKEKENKKFTKFCLKGKKRNVFTSQTLLLWVLFHSATFYSTIIIQQPAHKQTTIQMVRDLKMLQSGTVQ